MKIVFAALMHESNTFSAKKTTFDMWIPSDWAENLNKTTDKKSGLVNDGMRRLSKEHGAEIIPGLFALAAGPTITADCYKRAVDALLDSIRPHKDYMDGLLLGLHGGAAVEGMDDVESDILKKVRSLIGEHIPISVPMDLHGNIGESMIEHCNIIVSCKEYPHTDMDWAIERGFELLIKTVNKEIKPLMAITKLPMMLPPAAACTMDEPMKSVNKFIKEYVQSHGLLDCSFFHGFPFSDIPCASSSVVTVVDGNFEAAHSSANTIASYIWSRRAEFIPMFLTPENGVAKALEINDGLVIINETSDNPGGGAPCDGTHTLKALLEANPHGACFGLISDPEVAKAAHAVGEGAQIKVLLGGKTDNIHGEPISVCAKVIKLSEGKFIDNGPMSFGLDVNIGLSARLRIGNVDVNVSSKPYQMMGDMFCRIHDIDITKLRILCLKSSQHFRAFYQPFAKAIITVDPPGIHTSNFGQLNYKNIKRPLYPLDQNTTALF